MQTQKIALVTGANRGIGLEISLQLAAKGYTLLLGVRDPKIGKKTEEQFKSKSLDAHFVQLDVSKTESITQACEFIKKEYGRLDVLVNNAGIFIDSPEDRSPVSAFQTDPKAITDTYTTNTLGPFLLCQKLIPLMQKNKYGRVVNISSGLGQLSEMGGAYVGYRLSKTALNAVTRIFADESEGDNVLVNSVCPGWVKTDMGGPEAERPIAQGAETPVWLATLPDGGPTGKFFRDKEEIAW
jgi:NAD(P)-dependent dehydrogenase (short-subunit alcohol dehydrogenase family)